MVEQISRPLNAYFVAIMFLQMIPKVSITDGEPTVVLGLIPIVVVSMMIDLIEDRKKHRQDQKQNLQNVQRIDTKGHKFIQDQSQNLRVGQVIKVSQNERFPADLILLKSSNPNGMAYVETQALDGETNLKHKSAIRDMQDTILSASDASKINANVYCDNPDDSLYNFDGLMTIKVKNSESQYKYPLSYSQLLLRGSSLKTTHWVYGIVVYTGRETKMLMHEAAMPRR